jgi:predicted nucleotidyltransferase
LHRHRPQPAKGFGRSFANAASFGWRSLVRARGDHCPDSDLDVLVDVEAGLKFSLIDLVGVSNLISDELGLPANMFMRRSLEPEFTASIRSHIVEVFSE